MVGLLLTVLAGLMMGNCILPLRFAQKWSWENSWLVFSLVSLFVIPWSLAVLTVPDLAGIYHQASWFSLSKPVLFGTLWGIAQVLFGLSAVRLGMSLAFAIVIGLGALLGSLVPLLVLQPEALGTHKGAAVMISLPIMLVGVAVCAHAGRKREQQNVHQSTVTGLEYRVGLLLAIIAGVFSCALNFAFAFGTDLTAAALRSGAHSVNAPYAVWALALLGGLAVNAGYSIKLLCANRTWSNFRSTGDSRYGVMMGLLWMGAIALYGTGSTLLGPTGPSLGWALFQIIIVISANVSGFIVGEWRGAPKSAVRSLVFGLSMLLLATIVIGGGSSR